MMYLRSNLGAIFIFYFLYFVTFYLKFFFFVFPSYFNIGAINVLSILLFTFEELDYITCSGRLSCGLHNDCSVMSVVDLNLLNSADDVGTLVSLTAACMKFNM